jgi:DmsE family decaheme c-type cytochrome
MKRTLLFRAAPIFFVSLLLASGARAAPASGASYVGSKECEKCHAEVAEPFQTNVHHQAELDGSLVGEHVGCESCHGPGSLHVAADGDEDNPGFHTMNNFKKMKPDEAAAVCQSCHKTGDQFMWDQSAHARNEVKCQDCHSIHNPKSPGNAKLLVKEKTADLCISCHHDKRAALEHTAHMPLREGAMSCADCHNPHGSVGPRMIKAASNTELCVSCHMDKRGPFLYEHPPVRENCVNCHMPHGSNNDKVLAGKRPYLCQRCHVGSRHPSTLYDVPDISLSGANKVINRSCTNCHSQIHGSNHPSGEFFER